MVIDMSLPVGASPHAFCVMPQASFDVGIMTENAKIFARGNMEVLNYILDILKNADFRYDPKQFLDKIAEIDVEKL